MMKIDARRIRQSSSRHSNLEHVKVVPPPESGLLATGAANSMMRDMAQSADGVCEEPSRIKILRGDYHARNPGSFAL